MKRGETIQRKGIIQKKNMWLSVLGKVTFKSNVFVTPFF